MLDLKLAQVIEGQGVRALLFYDQQVIIVANSVEQWVIVCNKNYIAETCSKYRVLEKLSPAAHGFERVNTAGQKKYFSVCKLINNKSNRGITVFKVRHPRCFASSRRLLVFLVSFYGVRGERRKESREKVPAAKALN